VCGVFYGIATVVLARHVGATTLIALIVTGQLMCSVVVDHFGVLGFEARAAMLPASCRMRASSESIFLIVLVGYSVSLGSPLCCSYLIWR
jgi:bacterial/archaeal transporter family-2 protein